MACETKDETINGVTYMTTQWPAMQQVLMKLKIMKIFGPAIFELVQALGGDKDDNAKQVDGAQKALDVLFQKSTPEDVVALIRDILISSNTKRDGTRISQSNIDEIYNDAGIMEMYKATFFVIKANYADFFKGQKAGEFLATVESQL